MLNNCSRKKNSMKILNKEYYGTWECLKKIYNGTFETFKSV